MLSFWACAYCAQSLVLHSLPSSATACGDERLRESRNQMIIEQRLNQVDRGRLSSSSQTTREEWIDALHELSSNDVDDSPTFLGQLPIQLAPIVPGRLHVILTNSIH
jgi:hypothetical protein